MERKDPEILGQVDEARLRQDADALGKGMDGLLTLLLGERMMRGLSPVGSQKNIEQFNSIQQATRSVLGKVERQSDA